MLFDDALVMTLYSIPFVLGMMAPGWKSIAVAVLGGVAVASAIFTANREGVLAALGLSFIAWSLIGFGVGVATRSVTLLIAPATSRPLAFTAAMILGYALPLVLIAGPSDVGYWLTRPPLASCAQELYRVRIGDAELRLPPAPAFSISIPSVRSKYEDRQFMLQFDSGLRQLCREAHGKDKALGPATLDIQPGNAPGWAGALGLKSWCELDEATKAICQKGGRKRPTRWIERIQLLGDAQKRELRPGYAAQRRLASTPRDSIPTGVPVRVGSFGIYPDGLRVAEGAEWRGSDGRPFRMFCEEAGETLLCVAEDTLPYDIMAVVTFRTRTDDAETDAADIRDYLRAFLGNYASEFRALAPSRPMFRLL